MIRNTCTLTLLILLGILNGSAQNQEGITHSGQKTGQTPYPATIYTELPNPVATDLKAWEGIQENKVSWGSTDIRYKKEVPMPQDHFQPTIHLRAWRGERVSAQWVVSASEDPVKLAYSVSDLVHQKDSRHKISQQHILSGFVRYVLTDELNKDGKGACGHRDNTDFDSTLVADAIDHITTELTIPGNSTRPGWIRVWVPEDAHPGKYKGTVTIYDNGQLMKELTLTIDVSAQKLPKPRHWKFHLDLWQNPYAVARYYNVTPWSDEHFEFLRQDMKHYADAGGNVITASITHKPWNAQTHDYFESMVTWMKKADGTWYFDYTIFDRWVEFMMDLGVTKQINCYSMIPWRLSFQYYDQATNQLRFIETQPGEPEYEDLWGSMLTSFATHLKKKGWFEKTFIAMDERPMEAMQKTLKVIRKADKNFKISLAGNLHPELLQDIDDYCISYGQSFTPEMKEQRRKAGQISTYYTSCSHPYPNTFTFSPPAQSEWLAWHAASENLDGFLRWAYNSWVLEPLLDSRFRTWAAGDTYFVYPGGRTSMRMERLVEGIQQFEKINLLKKEFEKQNNQQGLQKLEKMLKTFSDLDPQQRTTAAVIHAADQVLWNLSK